MDTQAHFSLVSFCFSDPARSTRCKIPEIRFPPLAVSSCVTAMVKMQWLRLAIVKLTCHRLVLRNVLIVRKSCRQLYVLLRTRFSAQLVSCAAARSDSREHSQLHSHDDGVLQISPTCSLTQLLEDRVAILGDMPLSKIEERVRLNKTLLNL